MRLHDRLFIVRCNIVEPGACCCLCGTYEIMQALQSEIPTTIQEETIQQYLRGTVSLCHGKPHTFSLKERDRVSSNVLLSLKSDLDVDPMVTGDLRETFQYLTERNSQLTAFYGFSYSQEGMAKFINKIGDYKGYMT